MSCNLAIRLWLGAFVLLASAQGIANASDLGTAGPFRSFGGDACRDTDPKTMDAACHLPTVDPTSGPAVQADVQMQRALRFLDLLRMAEARAALDAALKSDPSNLKALTLRARLSLMEGRAAEAETDINAGLALSPQNPVLLATKAFTERDPQELAQGLRDATLAVSLQADNPDIRWIRSTIYATLRRDTLAFADLSYALAKDPGFRQARVSRAEILARMGNDQAAILDADELLKAAPGDIQALEIKADSEAKMGDDTAALQDLDAILGKDDPGASGRLATPHFRDLAIKRAGALVRLKRNDEATKVIDAIVAQGGLRGILRMQVYLQQNGFPNVAITGKRSDSFDVALQGCFADRTCGPHLVP